MMRKDPPHRISWYKMKKDLSGKKVQKGRGIRINKSRLTRNKLGMNHKGWGERNFDNVKTQ